MKVLKPQNCCVVDKNGRHAEESGKSVLLLFVSVMDFTFAVQDSSGKHRDYIVAILRKQKGETRRELACYSFVLLLTVVLVLFLMLLNLTIILCDFSL